MVTAILALSIFIFRGNKSPYKGCTLWLFAPIIGAVGLLLFSFHSVLPELFTILIANLSFIAFYAFFDIGMKVFCNKNSLLKEYVAILIVYIISFYFFVYVSPNPRIRIILISFYLCTILASSIYSIYKHLSQIIHVKHYFMIILLSIMLFINLFRGIYHIFYNITVHDFLTFNIMSKIIMLTMIVSNIIIIVFMLFIIGERMRNDLIAAHQQIKILQGLLPMCSRCKRVRDDEGLWKQVETYIEENSEAFFSHSLCPACMDELYGKQKWYKKMKEKNQS